MITHRFGPEATHCVKTAGQHATARHIDSSGFTTHRSKTQDYCGSPSFFSLGAITIWQ
jgi:hypothetical protein